METKPFYFQTIKFAPTGGMVAGSNTIKMKTRNDYKKIDLMKMKIGEVIVIKRVE